MNQIIDTRVSPQMRARLLVNRHGKLHREQLREIVLEPVVTILLLMVPTIILLRSFLLTLFVGGLWMIGVGGLLMGTVMLVIRVRRYGRVPVHFGVFRSPSKLPSTWMFWKATTLVDRDGNPVQFKLSLAPDKNFQPDQSYIVYYLEVRNERVLLSFAPADHLEVAAWRPADDFRTHFGILN